MTIFEQYTYFKKNGMNGTLEGFARILMAEKEPNAFAALSVLSFILKSNPEHDRVYF